MARIQELLAEKRQAIASMNDVAKSIESEKRSMSDEERTRATTASARCKEIDKEVEFLRETEQRNKEMAENKEQSEREERNSRGESDRQDGGAPKVDGKEAYSRYLKYGLEGIKAEERSFLQAGRHLPKELRAQSVGDQSKGGITVHKQYTDQLISDLKDYSGIMDVCDVMQTETGGDLIDFTMDDTDNEAVQIAELVEAGEDDVDFATRVMKAYKFTSKAIVLSREVVQDAGFDIEAEIRKVQVERVGRSQSRLTITGSGVNTPQGVLTGAGRTANAAGLGIGLEDLIKLKKSIDPAYRRNAKTLRMVLNDDTDMQIQLAALASGHDHMWVASLTEGDSDKVLGVRTVLASAMPNVGADNASIVIGDFSWFRMRIVRGFAITRMVEKYALKDAIGYVGFVRWDSKVRQPKAFGKLVHPSA